MKRCKLALRNPVSASPAAGVPVLLRRQRTFSAVSPSPTHSLSLSLNDRNSISLMARMLRLVLFRLKDSAK